jgi:hypothetical protein
MPPRPKTGLTLIEMLVAMTASLILFGAVVTILQILGDAVSKSRRTGRLDSDMCSVRTRLQLDLAGVTANRDPSRGLEVEVDSGSVSGYFEVIEGPNSDLLDYSQVVVPADFPAKVYDRSTNAAGPTSNSNDRIVGDTDDLLFFTTSNVTLDPFMGKFGNDMITAEGAEVAYFCRPTPGTSNPTLYTLYRRQLLIIGSFPRAPFTSNGTMPFDSGGPDARTNWNKFYNLYDLSARRENNLLVLNTANDLQRRKNRFAHDPMCSGGNQDILPLIPNHPDNVLALASPRQDEDVIVKNVLAFDVRLLDPQAVERQAAATVPMQPGDELYWTTNNSPATSTPVYGDLGFNAFYEYHNRVRGNVTAAPGVFSGYGETGHRLLGTYMSPRTYDTWTTFYGTNNQDDDGVGGVTPAAENAERAPYREPLGGIQVIIRLYDPETKTVRQATISQSFKQ